MVAGLINGHGVDFAFRNHERLLEGYVIHTEQDGLCVLHLPLFRTVFLADLARLTILDKCQDTVQFKREYDIAFCVCRDLKIIHGLRRDAALHKVGQNLFRYWMKLFRVGFHNCFLALAKRRRNHGCFQIATKILDQIANAARYIAGAATTVVAASRHVHGKGVPISAVSTVTKWAIFGDHFISANTIVAEILSCYCLNC